jgi:AbrB family looped-hinge helix DNA binding protein
VNAIVEIDKAGRIVIPKKMRDSLHLGPGAKLALEQIGETLSLKPAAAEAQLIVENGAPLIFPADRSNAPAVTVEMINELIAQSRLERDRRVLGLDPDNE